RPGSRQSVHRPSSAIAAWRSHSNDGCPVMVNGRLMLRLRRWCEASLGRLAKTAGKALMRGVVSIVAAATAVVLATGAARAANCPGKSALGTFRTLSVSASDTPRVGVKEFPATLPLADKEVVLTFDDGPFPPTTRRVLAALADQCVRATFFLIGQNA